MNEEILLKLYNNAEVHFTMPSFDDFKADMEDEDKLSKFRESMSTHYDIPDITTLKKDLGFGPGKKDVVVEEDVVTATEEVSASGVGPLAPQGKDEFSLKEQIKKQPKAKEVKEVPSVFYDGIDLKEEEKVVEDAPSRIVEINTEVEDAAKRLADYNQKLISLASDIGVIDQQLKYNPQYKNDTSYVANARAKYDEYQALSKEAQDLSEYYGNDLAGWRQTAMQSLPEYTEVLGEGATKFDQDYFNKIENDINNLRSESDKVREDYGPATKSIVAMGKLTELQTQVIALEKLKIDAIKRNTDINQFEFGSKYFLEGKEVSRSKLFEYLGSNEVVDLQNNDPSVVLPIKIVNDSYAQFALDTNKKALETAEWVRPLKGFAAGAFDIFVKPIKGRMLQILSPLVVAAAGAEADETGENPEDVLLAAYDAHLKETSERIKGPQLYREQDVIDRALAGDYTGFVKGAAKLSIESGAYLVAGMIPTVGPYIVANAMQYNSYFDLRREGVSKGRAAIASGAIGLIGLADQLNFNKLIRGTLAANTRIAANATSRGSQFTISAATKNNLVKSSLKALTIEPSTEFVQGFSESVANQWAKDKGINMSEAMRDGAIEASASLPTSTLIASIPGVRYVMMKNKQLKAVEALTNRMEQLITPDLGADVLTVDEIKANKAEAAILAQRYIQTFEQAEISATKATKEEFDAIATLTASEAVLQRAMDGRNVSPEQKADLKSELEEFTKKKEEALDKIEKRDIFGYKYDKAGNQEKDKDGNPIKTKARPRVLRDQPIIIDGEIPSELKDITPSSTTKNADGETRNVYLGADLIDAGIAKGKEKMDAVLKLYRQRKANEEEIEKLEKNTTRASSQVDAEIDAIKEKNADLTKQINEIGGVENQIQTIKGIIADQDLSKVELLDFQNTKDILKWAEKAFKDGLLNELDYIGITKGENRTAEDNGFMVRLAKQEGETDGDRKKVIIINKDVAAFLQESNVTSHEFLHTLLAKAISDNPSLIFSLKESFEKYLKEINPESLEKGEFRDRLQDYKDDNEKVKAEEFLTLFLDAMAGGHIKLKENLLVKLGDIFRRIIQSLGGKSVNVKFNTGKDVLNFIKDYNTSIEKGKLTTAQRNLFNKGQVDVGGEIQSFSGDIATADAEIQETEINKRVAERKAKIAAKAEATRLAAKAEVKRKADEARARKAAKSKGKPKTKKEIAKEKAAEEAAIIRKQEADAKKAARKKAKEKKEEAKKTPKDIAKEISEQVTKELTEEEGGSLRASKASKLESLNLEFEKLDSEWNSGSISMDQFEAKEAAIEKKIADLESQPDDLEEEEVVTVKKEKPEKKETKKEKKPEGKKLSPDEAKEVEDNITEYQKESAENDELAAAANVSPQETSKMRKLGDAIDTSLKDTISSFAESQTKLLFDPIPNEARNGVTRSEFKETMISDIRAMVFREFKQGKQNIETFIVNRGFLRNKNLAKRLGIASVEEGITKDISDIKGVASDGGSNFDEQSDSEIELAMDAIEESKKIKLADKIFKGNEDIFEEALLAVEAGLDELPNSQRTFKGIPNMISEQLAELVGVRPEQITDPYKAIQKSDVKGIVEFINTIKGDLLKTLPEGFVRSVGATANKDLVGTATGINEFRKIRDAFYEQREDPIEAPTKTGRVRTQPGLKPFSLRRNITMEEFLEFFQMDKDGNISPDVKTIGSKGVSGAMKNALNLVGKLITNQIIREFGDITPIERENILAGKASIMYSKASAKLQGELEKPFPSTLSESSIRKSKISKGDLNLEFNKILEDKSSIAADKVISKAQATNVGRKKGRFKFFIPPAAEDFMGLMYATLSKGKLGENQQQWYKENLSDPYARAMRNISAARVTMIKRYNSINKALDISSADLSETMPGSIFTKDQAIRAHIWATLQMDIPGIDKADLKEMADFMDRNPRLKKYAKYLIALTAKEGYPKASEAWTGGNIKTDIIHSLNTDVRKTLLKDWKKNADIIFSEENKNKLLAIYGKNYVDALTNSINRMTTGRNKPYKGGSIEDAQTNRFVDWINGQTGVIMFVNVKSAILQTISAANFVNMTDNNVVAAGKAMANQKQFWSDFTYLFNSDYLLERRNGLKMEVAESELAEASRLNGYKGVRAKLLKAGFKPTQIADSFAIAFGGATFYRNRLATYKAEMEMDSNKKLVKKNTDADAEQFAFDDFREIAEESQQSSRPDKISQQQAGTLGRVVLAFGNTPAQYARIMKKAFLDLKNGRGDAKTHIAKIMYYGFLQNIIFNTLQQAVFALAFDDEDDEKQKDKAISVANGMLDSILRGIGVYGALIAAAKNTVMRIYAEGKEAQPDFGKEIVRGVASFSPPLGSLASKLYRAGDIVVYEKDKIREEGFNITNPLYEAGAVLTSAFLNLPLDRLYTKAENVSYALSDSATDIESIALISGWSKWSLGITEKEREAEKKQKEEEKKAEKKAKEERENKQGKGGYKRKPRVRLNKTQKDKLKEQQKIQKAIESERKKQNSKWW